MHKKWVCESKDNPIGMKIACILKTYRTCNSTVWFSKYEFNNKLFGDVTLFRVTSGVTWI